MNLKFLGFMALLIGVVIIGLLIYFFRLIFKERDEPEDAPLHECNMPQYSNGHVRGITENMEFGDERVKIKFWPRDIKYIKWKKKLGLIKPITVIYDKKFFESFAEGEYSAHRQITVGYPTDSTLLPEGLKNRITGKAMMQLISEKRKESDEIDHLKKINENQNKIMKEYENNEMAMKFKEDAIKSIEDLRKLNTPPRLEENK